MLPRPSFMVKAIEQICPFGLFPLQFRIMESMTKTILSVILMLVILAALWALTGMNHALQTTEYTVKSADIPAEFDGFKILQLSDLHGKYVKGLDQAIRQEKPDLILCTGDIFDGVRARDESWRILDVCQQTAPTYLVSGNHEKYSKDWPAIQSELEIANIHLLDDRTARIEKGNDAIALWGIQDPGGYGHHPYPEKVDNLESSLAMAPDHGLYTIALFHRPNMAYLLPEDKADLILAGHIHGGQWRIGSIGVAGPGTVRQVDLFPQYTSGFYYLPAGRMLVSRGLGDQMKIPRIHNRPELVKITLESASQPESAKR